MADQYASTGSEALENAISAAYKQVYGNLGPTESQRSMGLESRLRNGDISVRDFVAGLAKSDLYKQNYFFRTSPIRGIELNLKHLLGRPPISQAEVSACISLVAEQGYDALVDKITHSGEYLEVFGTDTVPYQRAWTSEAGFLCSTFVNHSQVTPGNAASDTITERRSQLVMALNNARNISTKKGFDVSGFVYSKAVQDPTSGAFKRMFNPKNSKTWGVPSNPKTPASTRTAFQRMPTKPQEVLSVLLFIALASYELQRMESGKLVWQRLHERSSAPFKTLCPDCKNYGGRPPHS